MGSEQLHRGDGPGVDVRVRSDARRHDAGHPYLRASLGADRADCGDRDVERDVADAGTRCGKAQQRRAALCVQVEGRVDRSATAGNSALSGDDTLDDLRDGGLDELLEIHGVSFLSVLAEVERNGLAAAHRTGPDFTVCR